MPKLDVKKKKADIERLERLIQQERTTFIQLHRAKRHQLDELQQVLNELLEEELEFYERKDHQ